MLPTLARKAIGQQSVLVRRRLRHAGLGEKEKAWLARNLGHELGHIQSQSLSPCEGFVTSASGFDLLCSYSWRAEPKKKPEKRSLAQQIYVPGEAPVLIPHKLPLAVTRRTGPTGIRHYRDANVARMRAYPFEPMFQSMRVLNPGFRFDGVDLIINRNSLGHLLRFASGTAKCTFRLDLAMVHNTLIVTPIWERVSQKNREPNNHGRDFEDLFARRGLLDGNTHHRAVRYDLGPLSCAVLCETDAALPSPAEAMASHEQRWAFHPHPHPMPFWMKRSQFSEAWQPNTDAEKVLFSPRSQTAPKSPGPLHRPHSQVIQRGTGTLSKDTAELVSSSRSGKKMVQLWLGRVPFLVHGIHSQGSFTEVNVAYYATSFGCFENQYQGSLRRLVSLIEELRQFAVSASDQRCIAICDKTVRPLRLRIFNPDRPPALPLPVDLRRHFWTGNKTGKQPSQ